MKRITLTLDDKASLRFIEQLLTMNVPFSVDTIVAQDPLVLAAHMSSPYRPEDTIVLRGANPKEQAQPYQYRADEESYRNNQKAAYREGAQYAMRGTTRIQRLTADGRTSYEVVEQKVKSFKGRKFHMREIQGLSESSGFQPNTLQNQLSIMVARGLLVKLNKWEFKVPPEVVKAQSAVEEEFEDATALIKGAVEDALGERQGGSNEPPMDVRATGLTSTGQASSTPKPHVEGGSK